MCHPARAQSLEADILSGGGVVASLHAGYIMGQIFSVNGGIV